MLHPSKLLFLSTLVGGTLIAISANSWFSVWMGLEINLLSFIPLMMDSKNSMSNEAALKYFLIQTIASTCLLFTVTLMHLLATSTLLINHNWFLLLISSTLLLKMGAAPFHFWFPGTMEGLNWLNGLILMTWQKIAPLILLSYTLTPNLFFNLIIGSSVIIGSLGGFNQTSLRKLMAYSSINHLGWMIAAMYSGENLWKFYFMIYAFLSSSIIFLFYSSQIFHINQNFLTMNNNPLLKFILFSLFLSLGGLPPFLGFLPKWLVIQTLTDLNLLFLITIMVVMTLITLFFYLRLSFSAFLFNYENLKWVHNFMYKNSTILLSATLCSISSLGLIFCSVIFITF